MESFKKKFNLEERKAESVRILEKYPERIPVIVERSHNCTNVQAIDRNKYLVPIDITMGQFMHVIRSRIKLDASQAIYLFINNGLPPSSELISKIYQDNKSEDGFLYITYAGESTFG